MSGPTHTRTPWSVGHSGFAQTPSIIGRAMTGAPFRLAQVVEEDDAAFIVLACNSHDELIQALRELTAAVATAAMPEAACERLLPFAMKAKAALAKATPLANAGVLS